MHRWSTYPPKKTEQIWHKYTWTEGKTPFKAMGCPVMWLLGDWIPAGSDPDILLKKIEPLPSQKKNAPQKTPGVWHLTSVSLTVSQITMHEEQNHRSSCISCTQNPHSGHQIERKKEWTTCKGARKRCNFLYSSLPGCTFLLLSQRAKTLGQNEH